MAGAVVLDTCVLVPSLQRDVLLECAAMGLFRPLWSEVILEELDYVLARRLGSRGRSAVEITAYQLRLRSRMTMAFPDALVVGWQHLEPTIDTYDPNDAHVVAAAVIGGADLILSDDRRGFIKPLPGELAVETVDEFLLGLTELRPESLVLALAAVAGRTGRHGPVRSVTEIVDLLCERNTPEFGAAIRPFLRRNGSG